MKKICNILLGLFLACQIYAIAKQNTLKQQPLYSADLVKIKLSQDAVNRSQLPESAYETREKTYFNDLDQLFVSNGIKSIMRAYIDAKDKEWVRKNGFDRWFLVHLDGTKSVEEVIANLKSNRYIEKAIPEYYAYLHNVPNDPYFADNWGHNNTAQLPAYINGSHSGPGVGLIGFDSDAIAAWDEVDYFGDPNIIIGIVDTGVDINHPDLRLVAGYDFGDNDNDPNDNSLDAGHGTGTSGIAAAIANNGIGVSGIAGGCSVMPLKVSNSSGDILFSYVNNAIIYAADHDVDVISMSFGSYDMDVGDDPAADSAFSYAYNNGVVLFASSGNIDGPVMGYPAKHPDVIAVGAASPSGERKNSNSSDGENWWGSSYSMFEQDSARAIDIMAPTILPATDIQGYGGFSDSDYLLWFNGTSCSCPYAAGVAALILSVNPDLSPAEVRNIITSTATDMTINTNAGWDYETGYGMVNACQALLEANPNIPHCHIVYPINNTGFVINSLIPVQVEATDLDDRSITEVRFYLDTNPDYVFSDATMPYEWTWNTAETTLGMHTIKAVAIDNDGNQRQHQIVIFIVSPDEEGFETGDFSSLFWHNNSPNPWYVQDDVYFSGEFSACSGNVENDEFTELKLKINVTQPGDINFYRKLSTKNEFSYLRFYIDDNLTVQWTGKRDWELVSCPVEPGLHTFSWIYYQYQSSDEYENCAWIDHLTLPEYETYFWPPRDLTAAGGNGFVLVYWKVPEAGIPVVYKIYRNDVLLTTITGTRYTDTEVTVGVPYQYRITAVYADGESEATLEQIATPLAENVIEAIIGSGTGVTSSAEGCPVNNFRKSLHGQMIYKASELNLQGIFGPVFISRLGFNIVTSPTYPLPAFQIRMAHTAEENVSQWQGEGNLITYYNTDNYIPISGGFELLTLDTPFLWNGIDNILIDTAFSPASAVSPSGTVSYTEIPDGYHYIRNNSTDQSDVFIGGTVTVYRPNLKISTLNAPAIEVNTTDLLFGNVLAGFETSKSFTITNTGTSFLTGEISVPDGFSIALRERKQNTISFSIAAGNSAIFTVFFTPESPGIYNGNLIITHNVDSENRIIALNAISLTAQNTPFIAGFETDSNLWTFANENQTNKWMQGTLVAQSGNGGLFISGDDGISHTYITNSASVSYFYRDIIIPEGTENCKLRFSWKARGEGTGPYFDYLRVYCVEPDVVPEAGIMLNTGQLSSPLNLTEIWKEAELDIPNSLSGRPQRIIFAWKNDTTGGTQPPAAVDNIRVLLNNNTDYAFVYNGLALVNVPAVSDPLGNTYYPKLTIEGITNPEEHITVTSGFASLNEPFSDAGMDFTLTGANFNGAEIIFYHNLGFKPYYLGYKIEDRGIWMIQSAAANWTNEFAYFTVPEIYSPAAKISFCFPCQNNILPPYPNSFTATLNERNQVVLSWVSSGETGISAFQIWRGNISNLSSAVVVSDLITSNAAQQNNYTYIDTTAVALTRYYYWLKVINNDDIENFWGPITILTSSDPPPLPPPETAILGVFPNPFNPGTKIHYALKQEGTVKFKIYNAKGQLINSFSETHSSPGTYVYEFDGKNKDGNELASGIYFCSMQFKGKNYVRKMMKTK
ncbi:MAG TPA: S8 family serine peptidase [Candidatus Cloacimonas sp.]|mgnify:FL=1|nr:S8 family serine peptidase [Candidatus Cloacimonas sp.]